MLDVRNLNAFYGPAQALFDVSLQVAPGELVVLQGLNGAGKSTLLKTIIGERAPDGGTVRIMPSIQVAYYRQDLGDVNPASTLYDLIAHRRPMWNRGQVQ